MCVSESMHTVIRTMFMVKAGLGLVAVHLHQRYGGRRRKGGFLDEGRRGKGRKSRKSLLILLLYMM